MNRYDVQWDGSIWRALADGKTVLIGSDRDWLIDKVREMARRHGAEVIAQDAYGRVETVYRYDHGQETRKSNRA